MDTSYVKAILANLTPEQVRDLAGTFAELSTKVSEDEQAIAEAQADARRVTCACGAPVRFVRTIGFTEADVRVGLWRRTNEPGGLVGGYIGCGGSCEYDLTTTVGHDDIDDLMTGVVFYSCGCGEWTRASRDTIVGWE